MRAPTYASEGQRYVSLNTANESIWREECARCTSAGLLSAMIASTSKD